MFQSPLTEVATAISLNRYQFAPWSTRSLSDQEHDETRFIICTPGVMGGKPRLDGRRISVQQIVVWHEYGEMSRDQIASEFDLSLEEIDAAISYYRTHRDAIDVAIRTDDEFVTMMQQQTKSLLR